MFTTEQEIRDQYLKDLEQDISGACRVILDNKQEFDDFHDLSVSAIKEALKQAYQAGYEEGYANGN